MQQPAVPTIDLAEAARGDNEKDWRTTATKIGKAYHETGFFIASGHNVSADLLGDARQAARVFFKLPEAEKRKSFLQGHGRGYIPFAAERLGATQGSFGRGDLKESFNVPGDFSTVPWPESPENFRTLIEILFGRMLSVAELLMELSATALNLRRDYFSPYIDSPKAILRTTYYPAVNGAIDPTQGRSSAHTDYGTLTVLSPDEKVGGLQIQMRDGLWIDVHCPANSFVVNIGDLMERWTNGRWRSTPHRVIIPPASEYGRQDRLSVVLLHNPNKGAIIAPLPSCVSREFPVKYPPIQAGDYLKEKSRTSRALTTI